MRLPGSCQGHVLGIRSDFGSLSLSQRVGFLRCFGLETGMVLEETTGCMNVFIVSTPNE